MKVIRIISDRTMTAGEVVCGEVFKLTSGEGYYLKLISTDEDLDYKVEYVRAADLDTGRICRFHVSNRVEVVKGYFLETDKNPEEE